MQKPPRLIGNRLALVGAVLYFLEWVAIVFIPEVGTERFGDDPGAIVDTYRGHAGVIAFAAGWFGAVLLGRILFAAALRKAFRDSGRDSLLVDFAVGAMIVSVALEIGSFGPVAAAGWIADTQADASAIVALDAAGSVMFLLVFVSLGVSVFAASAAMLGSGLFPRWLGGLGLLAGGIGIVGGIIQVAAVGQTGALHDAGGGLTAVEAFGFWVWLIASSVILWRRAPHRQAAGEAP